MTRDTVVEVDGAVADSPFSVMTFESVSISYSPVQATEKGWDDQRLMRGR